MEDNNNRIAVIGSFILAFWQALATPLFALLALVIAPLPPLVRYGIIAKWSASVIFFARVFCGINYRVIGRENIPDSPCIFFSRHESTWETLAFQQILPPQSFILRRNLLSIPFFGWGLRQMSPIAIDRERGVSALKLMLKQGRARLSAGFCIVIFPEGTRMAPGQSQPFRKGGEWLAGKLAVPVVPVYLDSGRCWGRHAFFKRRGLITVRIGKPIESGDEDINAQVQTFMQSFMRAGV